MNHVFPQGLVEQKFIEIWESCISTRLSRTKVFLKFGNHIFPKGLVEQKFIEICASCISTILSRTKVF